MRFIDDAETRDKMMEPVWNQDRLIREYRRRRRNVVDVDPDSGEVLELAEGASDEPSEELAASSEGSPEPG